MNRFISSTYSYLEAEHQVIKLEQVSEVQLQTDRTHLCRKNKRNISISITVLSRKLWGLFDIALGPAGIRHHSAWVTGLIVSNLSWTATIFLDQMWTGCPAQCGPADRLGSWSRTDSTSFSSKKMKKIEKLNLLAGCNVLHLSVICVTVSIKYLSSDWPMDLW